MSGARQGHRKKHYSYIRLYAKFKVWFPWSRQVWKAFRDPSLDVVLWDLLKAESRAQEN